MRAAAFSLEPGALRDRADAAYRPSWAPLRTPGVPRPPSEAAPEPDTQGRQVGNPT